MSGKPRLVEPPADSSALELSARMTDSLQSAVEHIAGELDGLIEEITRVKLALLDDGELLKLAIGQHFALGAEALAFRDLVRARLVDRIPDAPQLQLTDKATNPHA